MCPPLCVSLFGVQVQCLARPPATRPHATRTSVRIPETSTRWVCGSASVYTQRCVWEIVWYGMVRYGMAWYGMVSYGMVWHGMVWYGMAWYGMVWHGIVWYVMVEVCEG